MPHDPLIPGRSGDPEAVTAEDLKRLPVLHQLLSTLNDPLASQSSIQTCCKAFPVLGARVIAFARSQAPTKNITQLSPALAIVGNRGLEIVLLQLLEDLTTLKADVDAQAARAKRW